MKLFKKFLPILFLAFFGPLSLCGTYNRLAIIIDEDRQEETTDRTVKAVTISLDLLIREQSCIILTSGNILHNYTFRRDRTDPIKYPKNSILIGSPLYKNLWRVFKIHGACYYLLIPQKYLRLKRARLGDIAQEQNEALGIKFTQLNDCSELLPKPNGSYQSLCKLIEKDYESPMLRKLDLHSIFISKTLNSNHNIRSKQWITYIVGHGSPDGKIVGVKSNDLLPVLDFFDTQLSTKLLYIDSCYAGGRNKQLLLRPNNQAYQYPLVVGAATDAPVGTPFDSISFQRFFTQAEVIFKYHPQPKQIAKITQHLAPLQAMSDSRHNLATLPQLLPAGDHSFVPLDSKNSTISLQDIAYEERELENKAAILLYQNNYSHSLFITPAQNIIKPEEESENYYLAEEFLTPQLFESIEWRHNKLASLALLRPHVKQLINRKLPTDEIVKRVKGRFVPNSALFPSFISMLHPDPAHTRSARNIATCHHFSEIVVRNSIGNIESPFFGLLRFIYDAFLDINDRHSKNIFLIDTLTGYNDFALFFELYAHATKTPDRERISFFKETANELITLNNVMISTKGGFIDDSVMISIGFMIDNQCWGFSFKDQPDMGVPWPFKKLSTVTHLRFYNQLVASI